MSLRVVSNRKLMLEGMTATVGHTETPVTCEEYCMSVVKDAVDWLMRDCFDRCQEGRSIVSAKLVSNTAIQPKNESGHCTKYRISFDFIPGPDGTCQWPAIWLLPDSQDTSSSGLGEYGHWPFSGELDIFETQNNYRRKFMTMHYGDVSGNHVAAGGTSRYGGGSAHFQFEWATDYIAWFQDGRQVQRFDKWAAGDENRNAIDFPAPFDQPFKLIVNFAMGGGLTGVNDYQKCTISSRIRSRLYALTTHFHACDHQALTIWRASMAALLSSLWITSLSRVLGVPDQLTRIFNCLIDANSNSFTR